MFLLSFVLKIGFQSFLSQYSVLTRKRRFWIDKSTHTSLFCCIKLCQKEGRVCQCEKMDRKFFHDFTHSEAAWSQNETLSIIRMKAWIILIGIWTHSYLLGSRCATSQQGWPVYCSGTVHSFLQLVITLGTLSRHNVDAFWYPSLLNRQAQWNLNFWTGSGRVTSFSCFTMQPIRPWLAARHFSGLNSPDHHSRAYEAYSRLIMLLYLPALPLCIQSSVEFCGSEDQSPWAAWPNTIDREKAMQSWPSASVACYLSISLGQREAWLLQN